MQNKLILPIVIGLIVVGGGSFYGGMQYAKSQTANQPQAAADARGGRNFGGGQGRGGGGGATVGEVVSKDATGLTIKLRDGGSKIVLLSSTTRVGKMTDGSLDDLAPGTNVMVMGTANADGSVTASQIQIRPKMTVQAGTVDPNAREVVVTASNFKFDPPTITAKQGEKIRIRLKNTDGFHDLKIDELNAATGRIQGGDEAVVEFVASKTGSFEYYCSVGNHRQMGMKGTLIIN